MANDWRNRSEPADPFRVRIQKPRIIPMFVTQFANRPSVLTQNQHGPVPSVGEKPSTPPTILQGQLLQWALLRRQRLELFHKGRAVQALSYGQELTLQLAVNENFLMAVAKSGRSLPEDAHGLFVSEQFSKVHLGLFADPGALLANPWDRHQFETGTKRSLLTNPIPKVVLLDREQMHQLVENIRLGRRFHQDRPIFPAASPSNSAAGATQAGSSAPPSAAHEAYQVQTNDPRNPVAEPETKQEQSWWDGVTEWADDLTLSDWVHGTLDVVGLIPGLGEVADGLNAVIYLAEGNYTDAALSAAAMIPLAGAGATAAKYAKKTGVAEAVVKSAKKIDPHKGWGKGQIPCFAAGTPVLTSDGMKPIDELAAGDRVFAWCARSSERVVRTVTHVHQGSTDRWMEVATDTQPILATARHPFWVEDLNTWVKARDLKSGYTLSDSEGRFHRIQAVNSVRLDQAQPTYNLTVDTLSNYFVGDTSLLVHNTNPNQPGHSNYRLIDPKTGKTVYHGRFGPGRKDATKGRHSRKANKADVVRIPPLKMVVDKKTRTYAEARRLEHERIIKEGTLNKSNPLANQVNGMGPKRFKKYYPNGC